MLGEWKLVHRFESGHRALYRVDDDIGEDHDLAAQYPEKVAELANLHNQWKARYYPNPVPRQTGKGNSQSK